MKESDPSAAPPTVPPAVPPAARPRSRLGRALKIAAVLAFVMAAFVVSIPYLLSTDWVRGKVEREMSRALGVPVTIADYRLGWVLSFEVEGITIDNPAGFAQDQKLCELRSMRGKVGLLPLLRGKLEINGTIEGLALRVQQRADGTTNLTRLGGGGIDVQIDPGDEARLEEFDLAEAFSNLRLDLELRDSSIEVQHEQHGVLEQLQNLHARASKEFGSTRLRLDLDTDLGRPDSDVPGRIAVKVDYDADPDQPIDADIDCFGVDLSRYRPVLALFLPAEQVTAFAGVVSGNAKVHGRPSERVTVEGSFEIEAPHFAGPLLDHMDIRAPRWTIRPNLTATARPDSDLPDVDVGRFALDLGFMKLEGVSPPAESVESIEDSAPRPVTCRFDVDLAALAEFGGSLPRELRGSGSKVSGTLTIPLRTDWADLTVEQMIAAVRLDATISTDKLLVADQVLEGIGGHTSLVDGKLAFRAGAGGKLDGGAVSLVLQSDLTELAQPPLELQLSVQGARVGGGAVRALQYVVPVLAGLADRAGVDYQSALDLEIQLSGPAMPAAGQPVLEWLNHWAGRGRLGLKEGSFTPAAALSQLLTLTGQRSKVEFDDIETRFAIDNGFVETELMQLESKGRRYGLRGRTSLAGEIDYTIDVRDALKGHRDGENVLKYLGDKGLEAKLGGTLDAPRLGMPDVAGLIQQAATKALEDAAKGRLEQEAGKLLKRLLPDPTKKKDGGP